MKLNHLNLVVANVGEVSAFFEKYFSFICTETKGNNVIAILKDAKGFTLVLMAQKEGQPTYPEAFHIGFMQSTNEEVDEFHNRLKAGGINIEGTPDKIRDSYGFYFRFDTIMIEVGTYLN